MTERPGYSLAQLSAYFLKLGSIGFGGPVALVGYMYRDLVEKRGWITDADYKEGLTLAQLMTQKNALANSLAPYGFTNNSGITSYVPQGNSQYHGLAIDDDNHVYVADYSNNRIVRFDANALNDPDSAHARRARRGLTMTDPA